MIRCWWFFCFFFYFLGSLHLYLSFSIHFFSLCVHVRRFLNTTFFCTSSCSCWIWRFNCASYYLTTRCFIHFLLLLLSSSFIWLHHFYQIGTGILAFFFTWCVLFAYELVFFISLSLFLSLCSVVFNFVCTMSLFLMQQNNVHRPKPWSPDAKRQKKVE